MSISQQKHSGFSLSTAFESAGYCMILCVLFLMVLPTSEVVRDHADLLEVNRYHNSNGQVAFNQLILWKWYREEQRYHVREWRLLEPTMEIRKRGRFHSVNWTDGQTERLVTANYFKDTYTQTDPEREDGRTFKDRERLVRPDLIMPREDPIPNAEVDQ